MTELDAVYTECVQILMEAESVVVCGHTNPDGDAVGSTLGLTLALREAGVPVVPTLADDRNAPATYAFLPGHDVYRRAADLQTPDVFVALDGSSIERLGEAAELARNARSLIVIDHHPDNTLFGQCNLVDPGAAATGQLVWRLVPGLSARSSAGVATCLYTALMTDTGRFSFSNTDAGVLRDASEMVAAGADPYAIYSAVYDSRSAAYLRLLGLVLSRVRRANGGLVGYAWIAEEDLADTGARIDEAEDLIDVVRTVGGVQVVLLAKVMGGTTRLSMRAKGPIDVGAVARTLGGGGHKAAAGATVTGDLQAALQAALPLLPGWSQA